MLAILLALAAQGESRVMVSNSAPPAIVVADSPEPVPVAAGPIEVAQVHVRVSASGKILLDEDFRVGKGSGATYSENRSEAPAINCSSDRYYGASERHSLSAQLNLRDEPQTGPAVYVTVTWQRPASSTVCPNEGSRSVSVSQTVPLAPGQTSTVRGDGGLLVTLSRR